MQLAIKLGVLLVLIPLAGAGNADTLMAGAARADITNTDAGPVNDPLYAKALVLQKDSTAVAIVTVDAVAIGEIGGIGNSFLGNLRARIDKELNIAPANVLVSASHCHGVVCSDVEDRTFQAVKQAAENLVGVNVSAGAGEEKRISQNRRVALKDGREADVRHAYAFPPDDEVAGVGPIDPEIGLLRLDKQDGTTLAVVYNFACHPILGVPSRANTADIAGFASKVIEDNLDEGAVALFLQGCAGDVNPVSYKDVNAPRDAERLGNLLGLSVLRALKIMQGKGNGRLKMLNEVVELPRADLSAAIASLKENQARLLADLKGTSLNLETFLPLFIKYKLSSEYPSAFAYEYLHEEMMGRDGLEKLDAENKTNIDQYVKNIHTMEELTRVQTNLDLLQKHQSDFLAAEKKVVPAEVAGVRIGEFVLVAFPGELSAQIGINIKNASPHPLTFVAGCTNGYLYYAPTAEQLRNRGGAQEDSDCVLAPEWQALFESKVAEMLKTL